MYQERLQYWNRQSCEFKPEENSTVKKSHKCTRSAKNYREVSALISCTASICHVYMKYPLKIKDSTFSSYSFGTRGSQEPVIAHMDQSWLQ